MDSAYKNQILTMLSKTLGNNKNPTNNDRNSIFLLLQYMCDVVEMYENTISKLDTILDKFNNCITDNGNIRIDLVAVDNNNICYVNKNDGYEYGNSMISIYNHNL